MSADAVTVIAALLLLVTGGALVAVALRSRPVDLEALLDLPPDEPLDDFEAQLTQSLAQRVFVPLGRALSDRFANLLPRNHAASIRRRLVLAGLSGEFTAEEYLAQQVVFLSFGTVGGAALGIMASWSSTRTLAAAVAGAALGYITPSARVQQARDKRVQSIQRDLPDILDLLAISVEAGVGLEGALMAATDRFHSPLGDELAHALSEMELGKSRREALHNLRARTEVPALTGFIMSLLQADALGMPLTQVLRAQAAEMRRRRTQEVREAAARLPVKLLFPLVLFILPSLFAVILGPAVLQIARNF